MKYGFVLSYGTPSDLLNMATAAEESGWDGVFTWDAISINNMAVYDPWVMMGAIAGVTERVTIGAMVLPLSRRRPWKVAKEATSVDHLSNGRLVLPVGLGTPEDRGFCGVNTDSADRRDRAERLDECLEILELAQIGDSFSYTGKHFQVEDMHLLPKPVQQRIPVWAVGAWPKAKSLARPARWDGIIPVDMSEGVSMFDPIRPEIVQAVAEWMSEHRTRDGAFDIVVEGKTRDAHDTAYVREVSDAGATWFIESRWDDTETASTLMERIKLGPPRF